MIASHAPEKIGAKDTPSRKNERSDGWLAWLVYVKDGVVFSCAQGMIPAIGWVEYRFGAQFKRRVASVGAGAKA